MKKPPAPFIPSPEWFDLKRRFYALLIREGCTPEMSEEIVRERHAMYMETEREYREMIESYEKQPDPVLPEFHDPTTPEYWESQGSPP